METVYFKGAPCHTNGKKVAVGEKAPCFNLVTPELKEVHRSDFEGKRLVLNIFPSLDTAVCQMSVRRFNKDAGELKDTVVLCVSMDLPFAAARFCTTEGLKNVIPASAFRSPEFAEKYGVKLVDGPLAGLLARSVIVIDPTGKVVYNQLVDEITNEPNYDAALAALK